MSPVGDRYQTQPSNTGKLMMSRVRKDRYNVEDAESLVFSGSVEPDLNEV